MANLYLGVYGTRYESTEPLYLTTEQGVRVWDRLRHRWLNWESLAAKAAAESHTWQPREVGIPSIRWQLNNSHLIGQDWAPGLDDTSGLASEAVTNGDDWTGADAGSPTTTPPTGWTLDSGVTCQNFSGTINVYGDPVLGGGMRQTVTVTPGEYYVMEILVETDTTGDVRVALDGISLPIGPGDPVGSSMVKSMSFMAPADGDVEVAILTAGGGIASIGHIRCFLESELTGSGPGQTGNGPTPMPVPETEVNGPYVSGNTTYFIHSYPASGAECMVSLDVDSDPDPDIKLTLMQVCESDIEDAVKMDIDAKLRANMYCTGLPCMTPKGALQRAYQRKTEPQED